MRRKFNTYIIDEVYMDNLVGAAINNLRDMVDIKGNRVHEYHNQSKVQEHLDKVYNIKVNSSQQSFDIFRSIYRNKATYYEKDKGSNYKFKPAKNRARSLLVKAVENLFRL